MSKETEQEESKEIRYIKNLLEMAIDKEEREILLEIYSVMTTYEKLNGFINQFNEKKTLTSSHYKTLQRERKKREKCNEEIYELQLKIKELYRQIDELKHR